MLALLLAFRLQVGPIFGLVASNDAKGPSNFFGYYRVSVKQIRIEPGDSLIYDVYSSPSNPAPQGAVDVGFTDGSGNTRDMGLRDQNGLSAHGNAVLAPARGAWYSRRIPLTGCAGRTTASWDVMLEGDATGRYAFLFRNLGIRHSDGSMVAAIDALPAVPETVSASGYTDKPLMAEVPPSIAPAGYVPYIERIGAKWRTIADTRRILAMSEAFADLSGSGRVAREAKEAQTALEQVRAEDPAADVALSRAGRALAEAAPINRRFVGHLIGHGHIDAQWLWEWQGGLQAVHDTWAQALHFMDEFPAFTYTQSSAAFYKGMEENFPDLFKQVQRRVREGRWEIVGGRVVEADENLIGSESHVRQFLLGQSYFRSRFGKIARVGWEPDTFGHTTQFPQFLRQSGIDYLYHYRAGRGEPLYHWSALDGSEVLAFDEAASGGWYGNGLSTRQFDRLIEFAKKTGRHDMAWIYGVGNHGGGPTRRQIETALKWQSTLGAPTVRFSTAQRFFESVSKQTLPALPVVQGELVGDAQGTFTSEAEVKRLNRQAEAAMLTAESASTAAWLFGRAYPKDELNRDWWDLLLQHHHDTIGGSGNFASYARTRAANQKVIASATFMTRKALETLALRVKPVGGAANVLVYNPTGWTRSGWIEAIAPRADEQNPFPPLALDRIVATGPDGKTSKFLAEDRLTGKGRFWVEGVPPFGFAVFSLKEGDLPVPSVTADDSLLANEKLRVKFNLERGVITKIGNLDAGAAGLGGLVLRIESSGTTAWHIGKKLEEIPLQPVSHDVRTGPAFAELSFHYVVRVPGSPNTPVTQTFRLDAGSDRLESRLQMDWNAVSHEGKTPGLRLVFDSGLRAARWSEQVPFGILDRPADGSEQAALGWASVADGSRGLTVLNDGMSGHSMRDGVLSMGVIRSASYPNPRPNPGKHEVGYALVPEPASAFAASRAAAEFSEPLIPIAVPYDAKGTAPLIWSPVRVEGTSLLTTGLKRTEAGDGFVVRFLNESSNATSAKVHLATPAKGAWVNFLEDKVGPELPQQPVVQANVRPWEIRTLRVDHPYR